MKSIRLFLYFLLSLVSLTRSVSAGAITLLTPEKGGTHLLIKCMHKIYDETNLNKDELTHCHYHFPMITNLLNPGLQTVHINPMRIASKFILLIRDPRDQIISARNWIDDLGLCKGVGAYPDTEYLPWFKLFPLEKLELLIKGGTSRYVDNFKLDVKIASQLLRISKAIPSLPILVVKFEDLVGPKGGGSRRAQHKTLRRITSFLEIPMSDSQIKNISDQLFGNTRTFRKGKIRRWEQHFDEELKDQFKEMYQVDLEEMGYEVDSSW